MLSPRTLALQALHLIEHALLLHDTNSNLYSQGRYTAWCKQEIKKANLQLIRQILRNSYLGPETGPVLPDLSRAIPARSDRSAGIGSIQLADNQPQRISQIHGSGCSDRQGSGTTATGHSSRN